MTYSFKLNERDNCSPESGARRRRFLTTSRVALAVAGAAVALPLVAGASSASAATTPAANISAAHKAVVQDMKTPTAINQTVPLPKAPPKGKSVVCLADDDVPSDYTICTLGIEPAAKAIGWNYSSIYFDPSNPASLDSALTSALAKNPAAVINVGGQPTSTYSARCLPASCARV